LRSRIESSLRGQPGFGDKVCWDGRLEANRDGNCHDNYYFTANGQDLLLRMTKRYRSLRTPEKAREFLPREAETLRRLAHCSFPYPVPKVICMVMDDDGSPAGLIESCLDGAALLHFKGMLNARSRIEVIAQVAAAVHQLPKAEFAHLPAYADSAGHVRADLDALSQAMFDGWPVAVDARDWITAHLTTRPAAVLHGDLLPQNLLWDYRDFKNRERISVVDWECARIGDPAWDLAVVTRGARQPLQESGGFQRLLAVYNEAAGASLSANAVHIHELLMHLRWLDVTAQAKATGKLEGHGPEQYAQKIQSMLRRFPQ
jgi:aminoglycoside phosphotransferase (APT) family kinase protein